jgi:hypothetical protein
MHALSPDEVDVYASLVASCQSAQVTVMHNHCMSEQGMAEGFRFSLGRGENNQFLPMNRRMFFRHSMVECLPSDRTDASMLQPGDNFISTQEDRMILRLLLRQNEVKDKLVGIMQRLYKVTSRRLFLERISLVLALYTFDGEKWHICMHV